MVSSRYPRRTFRSTAAKCCIRQVQHLNVCVFRVTFVSLRVVSDLMDEALDVVRELEESNDDIDDVVQKVTLKRKQQSTRPKRSCTPSVKAIEQAALPSASDTVTECDSFDDMLVEFFAQFF